MKSLNKNTSAYSSHLTSLKNSQSGGVLFSPQSSKNQVKCHFLLQKNLNKVIIF